MNDETRAELRRDLGLIVQVAALPGAFAAPAEVVHDRVNANAYRSWAVGVAHPFALDESHPPVLPPLTPGKQLALSVLLGDESVIPQVLAEFMLDAGHEYATACYEKGKRDGVAECMNPTIQRGPVAIP